MMRTNAVFVRTPRIRELSYKEPERLVGNTAIGQVRYCILNGLDILGVLI